MEIDQDYLRKGSAIGSRASQISCYFDNKLCHVYFLLIPELGF